MQKICSILHKAVFVWIPVATAYFIDFRGVTSRLDEVVSGATPILGASLPFIVIGCSAVFAVSVFPPLGRFVWERFLDWQLDRPAVREFVNCCRAIDQARYDLGRCDELWFGLRSLMIPPVTDREEEILVMREKLSQLQKKLLSLGINQPDSLELHDSRVVKQWLHFLGRLSVIAHNGDIKGARELDGSQAHS